jgi:hypothetical protein
MTTKTNVTVRLTDEISLEQALKEAGVEEPASLTKLTITGSVDKEEDVNYIWKMKTLQELDISKARIALDIEFDLYVVCASISFVTVKGRCLIDLYQMGYED